MCSSFIPGSIIRPNPSEPFFLALVPSPRPIPQQLVFFPTVFPNCIPNLPTSLHLSSLPPIPNHNYLSSPNEPSCFHSSPGLLPKPILCSAHLFLLKWLVIALWTKPKLLALLIKALCGLVPHTSFITFPMHWPHAPHSTVWTRKVIPTAILHWQGWGNWCKMWNVYTCIYVCMYEREIVNVNVCVCSCKLTVIYTLEAVSISISYIKS